MEYETGAVTGVTKGAMLSSGFGAAAMFVGDLASGTGKALDAVAGSIVAERRGSRQRSSKETYYRAILAKINYPNIPYVSGVRWNENYAFFKAEGSQINIGLGKGKALEIFNNNISTFKRME